MFMFLGGLLSRSGNRSWEAADLRDSWLSDPGTASFAGSSVSSPLILRGECVF